MTWALKIHERKMKEARTIMDGCQISSSLFSNTGTKSINKYYYTMYQRIN